MLLLLACLIKLFLYCFHGILNSQVFLFGADMVLGAEKRSKLAKVLSVRDKATSGGDGKFMELFSESCAKGCRRYGCICARSSEELW